jgi:putative transcriptional regulator
MKNKKRDMFSELMAGVGEMGLNRQKKITLRTTKLEPMVLPKLNASKMKAIRERLNISSAVFAQLLLVSPRTLEGWEHGRYKIPPQAVALILMFEKYPDTLERLRNLAA